MRSSGMRPRAPADRVPGSSRLLKGSTPRRAANYPGCEVALAWACPERVPSRAAGVKVRPGAAMRILPTSCILALALTAMPVGAVTVTAPQGPSEVFARAEMLDLVALLRLAGADVNYAPGAGSYVATGSQHEVQFTPGGTLAVVDSKLTALPGPVRVLDGHVVGSVATANALLAPFGWGLHGSADAPALVHLGGDRLSVSVVRGEGATTVVVRGTAQKPRVINSEGAVALQFALPVELDAPVSRDGDLLGGELRDNALIFHLSARTEVASTYALDNPPRFVVRLAARQTGAQVEKTRAGTVVVLDPGHGGDDQGAKGPSGELEKDITLAVARATSTALQAAGVVARLTREGNESLALVDRTAAANRLQAAVFVSIHANASPAKGARGTETYFMSADASDPLAAQAAERENAGSSHDNVQLILWDLAHVANLNSSARLARAIQDRLNALQGIKDRGVRQAPFVVLTGATMPAALVEVGFLSNPEEAQRLTSRDGQEQVASALAGAIVDFLRNAPATSTPTAP
jgi:N-acetylmuramoyl-L-alanine amidase